jgi:hypothetical protein
VQQQQPWIWRGSGAICHLFIHMTRHFLWLKLVQWFHFNKLIKSNLYSTWSLRVSFHKHTRYKISRKTYNSNCDSLVQDCPSSVHSGTMLYLTVHNKKYILSSLPVQMSPLQWSHLWSTCRNRTHKVPRSLFKLDVAVWTVLAAKCFTDFIDTVHDLWVILVPYFF